MQQIAKIVPLQNLPFAKNQIFSYLVPKELANNLKIGQEIKALFGKTAIRGIVLNIEQKPKKLPFALRAIEAITYAVPLLTEKQILLAQWISENYHASLGLSLKLFLPKIVKRIGKFQKLKISGSHHFAKKIRLTDEQTIAYKKITAAPKGAVILLDGITGSGKTEVYLTHIKDLLKKNHQVAVLVPEISLTPQTIMRFLEFFDKEKIVLIHSRLSKTERYMAWQKIRENKAKIVIGPRSILFAPYQDLKLIVLDEEHDSSYKQFESMPRYQGREVALRLAEIFDAKVVLSSATPSVESYYHAKKGKYVLCELHERFHIKEKMPEFEVVDMKNTLLAENSTRFSETLIDEISKTLENKRQVLLFLNRRGNSTFVMCRDCGYVLKCPKCDIPFVFHSHQKDSPKNSQNLHCHHCNQKSEIPGVCPRCGSVEIKRHGAGTQKLEDEIGKLFPKARVLRLDTDAMNKKSVHHNTYHDFRKQKCDILIGTQMIAKGWDIPGVDLVGIISIDSGLNMPDFRASERTFQLITQVAGRTGRKDNPGKVILQTQMPENWIIQSAVSYSQEVFYKTEISHRQELNYPPFSQLIKIIFRHTNREKAENKIKELGRKITFHIEKARIDAELIGPSPAFIPKERSRYIWQILLKTKNSEAKKHVLQLIPPGFIIDIDPESTL